MTSDIWLIPGHFKILCYRTLGLIYLFILCFSRPPLTLLLWHWMRGTPPHDCHLEVEFQVLHLASFDTQWEWGSLLLLGRNGSSSSLLGVCWYHTTWEREVSLVTAPHVASLMLSSGESPDSPRDLLWHYPSEERNEFFLPLSKDESPSSHVVSTDTTPAEEWGQLTTAWQGWKSGLSIQSLLMEMGNWLFWIAGFSKTQSRIDEAKRNPREPTTVFIVPQVLTVCLLSTFQSLPVFVLYIMSRGF